MKKLLAFTFLTVAFFCLNAQKSVDTLSYMIGETTVAVEVSVYGSNTDITYINLHSDEETSVEAARKILEKGDGKLIRILNNRKRNISFRLNNEVYAVDPNRIFSRIGIERTLKATKNSSPGAVNEVEKFANALLALISKDAKCVIALHNNTEGGLAISSYMKGNIYANDAIDTHENPQHDPDDFLLTTDRGLFEKLKSKKFNTVLQDNENVQQDGSLSVYFGDKNRCYVNIETEHGRVDVYQAMLLATLESLNSTR